MRTGSKIENPSTTRHAQSRELQLLLFNFLCNVNRAAYKWSAEKWVTSPSSGTPRAPYCATFLTRQIRAAAAGAAEGSRSFDFLMACHVTPLTCSQAQYTCCALVVVLVASMFAQTHTQTSHAVPVAGRRWEAPALHKVDHTVLMFYTFLR